MSRDALRESYDALPNWCSVKEVASFLGVSVRTVYDMLSSSELKGAWRRADSGRWRIPKESLVSLIGLPVGDGEDAA